MKKYLTKTGLLLVAGICFIAGVGFISSIYLLYNAREQAIKDITLDRYNDGLLKEVENGKVIEDFDKNLYVIIDNEVYKVEK
jgi:hypothetical protein